jgi:hypothetical protein
MKKTFYVNCTSKAALATAVAAVIGLAAFASGDVPANSITSVNSAHPTQNTINSISAVDTTQVTARPDQPKVGSDSSKPGLTTGSLVPQAGSVCGEGAGDCCSAQGPGNPGCEDVDCCELICAQDPFCCDNTWDGLCAGAAEAQCEVCAAVCGDGVCGPNQNCLNCPEDCGDCPPEECPDGTTPEGEPCGTDVNGGCNMDVPGFTSVSCGETICGSAWAQGGTRDTDWFEIVTTEPQTFTWTVTAAFPVVIGYVDTGGSGNCADATTLDPFATGAPGQEISITVTLGPGTHWFFVADQAFDGNPCGSGANGYLATLECEDAELCFADVTGDGAVGPADLIALLDAWGPCPVEGLPGNCEGFCGGQSPDGCWCDETCCNLGDCCFDKFEVCGGCAPGVGDCPADLNGDGVVDWFDLLMVLSNWGCVEVNPCGDPAAGDCCEANPTPNCSDLECCEQICADDAFCCEVEWDSLCAEAANDPDTGCDICQPFECDGTDEGEPCGDDVNGGCNMDIPQFGPISCGETICGTAWAQGGTRDTDWFEIVTTETQTFTWTVTSQFNLVIGYVDTGGSGNCADATALDPFDTAGPDGTASITVTLGPGTHWFFVADQNFDGNPCGSGANGYAATLTCEGVEADCGVPGTGNCCQEDGNGTPYCDNAECCEQICADDPFCCDVEWDSVCAAAANDEETGCSVCFEPACGVSGTGDCCEAQTNSPFCEDEECCNLICAADPFCCNTNWDGLCAGAAQAQCEVCNGGPGEGTCAGNCGGGSGAPGCYDGFTCDCYCDEDCDFFGDCCDDVCDECPELSHCDGGPPAECDCDEHQGGPGCPQNPACESCVCALDAFCCNNTWDGICADIATGECADACCDDGDPPPAECDCDEHQGGPGCPQNPACESCVCALDAFCCNNTWDGICADIATGECADACCD